MTKHLFVFDTVTAKSPRLTLDSNVLKKDAVLMDMACFASLKIL